MLCFDGARACRPRPGKSSERSGYRCEELMLSKPVSGGAHIQLLRYTFPGI
jgi:hypothetical protein